MEILDKILGKDKEEGQKIQSISDLQKELQSKIGTLSREDILKEITTHAEKQGKTFESPEKATEYAERYLDKELTKQRLKEGLPVCCVFCGKGGANKTTGPLMRHEMTKDGQTYRHQNCLPKKI